MLDINFIRQNRQLVEEGVKAKGRKVDIEKLLKLDKERRDLMARIEKLRSQSNKKSDKFKTLKDGEEKQRQINELQEIKRKIKTLEPSLKEIQKEFEEMMRQVPNPPLADVPRGRNEKDNQIIRVWGRKPQFDFQPKDHIELGRINKMIDIERATKVSGARFYYLIGKAVKLEMALVRFALDKLEKKGFEPVTN
jgi:seryl-tRNA synthetase